MSANTPESLLSIFVTFSGPNWDGGNDQDLRALDRDPRRSGVGIFRDSGTSDDALDSQDTPVVMAATPTWGAGNTEVRFDFTAGGGTFEPVPSTVTGQYHWIIAIRLGSNAATLTDGETIRGTVRANQIVATDNPGTISQPFTNIDSNDLTVDLTEGVDMVGASGFPWVGPASVQVNSKAVLGIHIVDGGIATNRGIQDTITSLEFSLVETNGAVSSGDLRAISTDPSTSGIALYRDGGSVDDAWDASDTGVIPVSLAPQVFPAGGATFTLTFSPGLDVPDAATGAFDFFLVVRTRDIVTGDDFRLDIDTSKIRLQGLLAPMAGSVDADLRVPITAQGSSDVMADSTPPRTRNEGWVTASRYLFASGLDLHFGNAMSTTQVATATGEARDDESGLTSASFSPEPSLASSPPAQVLAGAGVWRAYSGDYGFASTSLATDSPADVTICDQVGNCLPTSQQGRPYRYIFETGRLLILPNPGWSPTGWTSAFRVDPPTGKLWFSNLIGGPSTATITVTLASLSGAELRSITASAELGFGGPTPSSLTFAAGTFGVGWSTSYTVNASATAANAPTTLTLIDNLGNIAAANFDYGLDTSGPSVAISSPIQGAVLGGNVVARATVTDAAAGVQTVAFALDGVNQPTYFDGTYYFAPISTAQFPDGRHRIQVQAWDWVGNLNVVAVDVTLSNAGPDTVPPSLNLVTPVAASYIQGTYTISASATDNAAVASVSFTLRRTSDNTLVLAAPVSFGSSGYYQATLDTLGVQDGAYWLTLTALDAAGLTATTTVEVRVDNTAPTASLSSPSAREVLRGVHTFRALASDAVGIKVVTLAVAGRTVAMTYNPQTGYYEYSLDTDGLAEGSHAAQVTVEDLSGKRTTTAATSFQVDNQVEATPMATFLGLLPLLAFLFLVFAFVLTLGLLKSGAMGRWLRGEGREAKTPAKANSESKNEGYRRPPPSRPPPGMP